jgi:hypothetical protein
VLLSLVLLSPQKEIAPHLSLPHTIPAQPQIKPNITNAFPGYQDYSGIVKQLEEWKAQAPGLVQTGTYGKSKNGANLCFIRITNLLDPAPKKKVLITACIHGNEPLAASTTMAFIGTMLSTYGSDPLVTQLINERDIYFVPVVSPDSYPNSRHVDGVDPNRDFPGPSNPNKQSVSPVKAIQTFFLQHRFNAVISGHTFGRVYLIPHGDKTQVCANNSDFQRVIGAMASTSNYRIQRACEMYSKPIFGTEVDWYYRQGSFAIVCEYGSHQRIPSMADTKDEFNRTYKATLHFIKEAPLVQISTNITKLNVPVEYFKERTRLFCPTSTIEVRDRASPIFFGMMSMSTTDRITRQICGKFDCLPLDVLCAPQVHLRTMLRHSCDIVGFIDPLQERVDCICHPSNNRILLDEFIEDVTMKD